MLSETVGAPEDALAILLLPAYDTLSPRQKRGSACVWEDGVALSPATAVDLGERHDTDGTTLFPRACKACTQRQAMRALQDHSGSCEQCVDDYTHCPVGLALVRLVREARR